MFHKVSINMVNNYLETPNQTNTEDPEPIRISEFIQLINSSLTLVLALLSRFLIRYMHYFQAASAFGYILLIF